MTRLITATFILLASFASYASANNVLTTQHELNKDQAEWVLKHQIDVENDKVFGDIHNFVYYYNEDIDFLWSVSINEYRKSGFALDQDLAGFFEELIGERINTEIQVIQAELDQAEETLRLLLEHNMPEEVALHLTLKFHEEVSLSEHGFLEVTSSKYPFLTTSNFVVEEVPAEAPTPADPTQEGQE